MSSDLPPRRRAGSGDRWILRPSPRPDATLRLICFGYAGGSGAIFRSWASLVDRQIEVCAVQLPGRGNRFGEPALTSVAEVVSASIDAVRAQLDRPFALFGHSMGALLAFETARALARSGERVPAHLFVSGCRAPQLPDPNPPVHALPDQEFLRHLQTLGGTPAAVLADREIMRLLLPTLRADFALSERYVLEAAPRLTCPISAAGGESDLLVPLTDLQGWREQTVGRFSLRLFPGDHFFLHTAEQQVVQSLCSDIAVGLTQPPTTRPSG